MRRFWVMVTGIAAAMSCSGSTEPSDPTVAATIVLSTDSVAAYPDRLTGYPVATVYNGSHQVIPAPVTWTIADTTIARKYTSVGILGKKLGVTTMTAHSGNAATTVKVAVIYEPIYTIMFRPGSATLYGADSIRMQAFAFGDQLDSLHDRVFTWATHNPGLITVSPSGMVHAVGLGTAYVIASSEGKTDSAVVFADPRLVSRITVAPDSLALLPGATTQGWTYHEFDASNTEISGRSLSWSSSDSTVATVSALGVNALKAGTVTLTASVDLASARVSLVVAPVTFTAVSAGGYHACGLTTAQLVYCWGPNYTGQLGTQTYSGDGSQVPAPVLGGLHFVSLALGINWSCALTAGGTPYCWGGQDMVGNGSWTPQAIPGVTLVSLSNGDDHACGLDASGTMWCWGGNPENLLYPPPATCGTPCHWTPAATGNGKHWNSISAGGGQHVCGIDTSNVTYCWGSNGSGQLGDSALDNAGVPQAVRGGITFSQVVAGSGTTCALTAAGDAYCWGSDNYGQLGSGIASPACSSSNPCSTVPVAVAGGHQFTSLGVDTDHACGLTSAGAVWCWGFDLYGGGAPTVPAAVAGSITFTSIAVNGASCGMATDGFAYCWSKLNAPVRVAGQQ